MMIDHTATIRDLLADNKRLQLIVDLAKMLIQPGPDGPQLEGSKRHRDALLSAVRGMKYENETQRLRKAMRDVLDGCPRCDYDEAEGALIDHCLECRRKVTMKAWELFVENRSG